MAVPVLGAAVAATEEPEPDQVADGFAREDVPWDEAEPRAGAHRALRGTPDSTEDEAGSTPDPEATQVAVPAFEEPLTADDDTDWHRPRGGEPPPPPPPLEPVAERPLFAARGHPPYAQGRAAAVRDRRLGDRRRRHLDRQHALARRAQRRRPDRIWPFGEDPTSSPTTGKERPAADWLRTPLIVLLVARRRWCGRHGLVPGGRQGDRPRLLGVPGRRPVVQRLERARRSGDQARRGQATSTPTATRRRRTPTRRQRDRRQRRTPRGRR